MIGFIFGLIRWVLGIVVIGGLIAIGRGDAALAVLVVIALIWGWGKRNGL